MRQEKTTRMRVAMTGRRPSGLPAAVTAAKAAGSARKIWSWGSDNLFPYALSLLARSSAVHRRILNDKAYYISGSGLTAGSQSLSRLTECANGQGETLRGVMQRVALDRCMFGNAFLEVVTDPRRSFLSLYHQDATRCRLERGRRHVVMHHDWRAFRAGESVTLPLWPLLEEQADGTCRALIHYKDYEPMCENYGMPGYIAGMNACGILYRTDHWNLSRLDNSFQLSGVMILDGETGSEQEAAEIARLAEERFAGHPGQVMFLIKNGTQEDTTKFVPITTASDGDWKDLHEQALADIVMAHSWYRTLSGMEYTSGFSAERVRHEYHLALNTLIRVEQQALLEPLRRVVQEILETDASELAFVNRPPFDSKPAYMRVWEARRADGYEYDPQDPAQQLFISQIGG